MTDHDILVLIRSKREDLVFTQRDLTEWLQEATGMGQNTCSKKARRLIKRLPIEALSSKIFRLLIVPIQVENRTKKTPTTKQASDYSSLARAVLDYLNEKAGTKYKGKPADILKIKARMSPPENHTLEDFKKVIDTKCAEWKGTAMEKYLRPETLFSPKFESYLNQSGPLKQQTQVEKMVGYDFTKYIQGDN